MLIFGTEVVQAEGYLHEKFQPLWVDIINKVDPRFCTSFIDNGLIASIFGPGVASCFIVGR